MIIFQHKESKCSQYSYKCLQEAITFYATYTHEYVYKHPEVYCVLFGNNIFYHKGKKYISLFTFDILHCLKDGIAAKLSVFLALET